ncbi:Putative Co/Zn/Cd efflux system membrane fusion protein [Minicystis rosea]|nr:Putative Co/Zn/Cd efflux system membrane fusion protein [Minicystis rosea]
MTTTTGGGTSRAIKIGAVAMGLGLFAFIGVRVRETLADRKALTSAMAEKKSEAQKRAGVKVLHAKPKTWRPTIPVTGTLAAVQEADIGFKAGGRLVTVTAKVGDHVKAGQLLASLDVSEARAQAAATGAAVRAAQVSYDMAKDAEKRTVALFEQKAVSDAENLATLNRAALALAQLEQARAQAQLATVGVGNGSLPAPFAGLVTRAPDGVGKIVSPGEPMFHVQDTSVLKLTATLTEADARLIAVGDALSIDGENGAAGKVTAVLGSLDAQTRRVPMMAEIPNGTTPPMLAGAFVRATIVSGREAPVLELPSIALRPGSQDEVVVHVDGRARLTKIAFATAPDGSLLIRSGITPADAIVASPSPEVRDGEELGPIAE